MRRCRYCGHDHDYWLCDLFSGAGGCSMGYHRAGFGIVGVDNRPQPRYPFAFVQADAMTFALDGFDAYHASPPCQDHSPLARLHPKQHGTGWMLNAIRERLQAQPAPWVIENVPGAPMRPDFRLCGCLYGLPGLRRDRWFETSWRGYDLRAPCAHTGQAVTVTGHSGGTVRGRAKGYKGSWAERQAAMGIDWMTQSELAQAIPPAYTEDIGGSLLEVLAAEAA